MPSWRIGLLLSTNGKPQSEILPFPDVLGRGDPALWMESGHAGRPSKEDT
jgi:hypothetical protein